MRVLVDADVMAYACGFAVQKTVYFEEGKPDIIVEPVENALSLVKTGLEGIYADISTWLAKSGEKCESLELYLTGKNNFRDKVATIRPYKGNRINKPKPIHYAAIRKYMTDVWSAKTVDGYEADDEVTIQAAAEGFDPDRVLIASVDKDLKTVPGHLFSFKKKESYLISEEEARGNFYRQVLTGDTVDNIVGCYRVGEKKAAKIIHDDMPAAEMWARVVEEFRESYEHQACPYLHMGAEDAAIETATLLHMLRSPTDKWIPPHA